MPTVDFDSSPIDDLAAPEKQGNLLMYWDKTLPGFGIRVMSTGVKSYIVQARMPPKPGCKSNAIVVTIGRCNLYSIADARYLAKAYLKRIREGVDPRAEPPIEINQAVTSDSAFAVVTAENARLRAENAALVKQNDDLNMVLAVVLRERDELKHWLIQSEGEAA